MRIYELTASVWLGRPREEVFPFFADASNLEAITPRFLSFAIATPEPIEMAEGTLIDYRLKVRGLPLKWRTLISAWQPPERFVDEQVRGPYRQWVHEHTFTDQEGGTLCGDRVLYAVPGGRLVHWLAVKRDVLSIFAYRQERLIEVLGRGTGRVVEPTRIVPQTGDARA
jgi:ligand-binding SRPBCC domain-containing protein